MMNIICPQCGGQVINVHLYVPDKNYIITAKCEEPKCGYTEWDDNNEG